MPAARPRILVVLHQEGSSPGRVGQLLHAEGFDLDIRRPPLGDPLPETLADHAGAVVFGGPMSANDEDEFVRRETDWLAVPLGEDKPFLGICLGAQMLVNHLGGRVDGHHEGLVEIGWYPLRATDQGKALMHWPEMVYQFHREGFTLPAGATLLATSDTYPNQAFRYGRECLGNPVPRRAHAHDDAALGGAGGASFRPAGRATRPRSSWREADLGHAPEALAGRVPRTDLRKTDTTLNAGSRAISASRSRPLKQFQEKWEPVFRPEFKTNT